MQEKLNTLAEAFDDLITTQCRKDGVDVRVLLRMLLNRAVALRFKAHSNRARVAKELTVPRKRVGHIVNKMLDT